MKEAQGVLTRCQAELMPRFGTESEPYSEVIKDRNLVCCELESVQYRTSCMRCDLLDAGEMADLVEQWAKRFGVK